MPGHTSAVAPAQKVHFKPPACPIDTSVFCTPIPYTSTHLGVRKARQEQFQVLQAQLVQRHDADAAAAATAGGKKGDNAGRKRTSDGRRRRLVSRGQGGGSGGRAGGSGGAGGECRRLRGGDQSSGYAREELRRVAGHGEGAAGKCTAAAAVDQCSCCAKRGEGGGG